MDLSPCVSESLCTLSVPVLRSIDGVVQGTLAQLSALLAQLEARSASLSVTAAPLQVAASTANQVIGQTLSIANFLPLDVIETCADLGDIQQALAEDQRRATAAVNDLRDDLIRQTSLKTTLDQDIAKLRADIDRFTLFRDEIQKCIIELEST